VGVAETRPIASAASTTEPPPDTFTTISSVDGSPDASADLDRAGLRASVEEAMGGSSPDPTSAQIDCYTDSLIEEVGLERLDALGVPTVDPLSSVVLGRMVTNIDDAAAYFTPVFTCLDGDRFVRESVANLPRRVQDCVVDAVLADREVRVIYVLGTKEGSTPDPLIERMTAPLIERSFEIQDDCIAKG
jgi:hypothetical protein